MSLGFGEAGADGALADDFSGVAAMAGNANAASAHAMRRKLGVGFTGIYEG